MLIEIRNERSSASSELSGTFLTPAKNEIHLWTVGINSRDSVDISYLEILDPAERARAACIKSAVDQACFIQRRAALRTILARYLAIAPQELAFAVSEFGKPSILAPKASNSEGLSFNASQSGSLALIAVGRSSIQIGVDIEMLRPDIEFEAIAARFFAVGETAALASLHHRDRVEGFFNAWTRKEALLKALGTGLSIPLNSFEVSLRPREPPEILRWSVPGAVSQQWRIHHLDPSFGYVGALAVDCETSVYQCWKWPS